jgi:hypothetical protein
VEVGCLATASHDVITSQRLVPETQNCEGSEEREGHASREDRGVTTQLVRKDQEASQRRWGLIFDQGWV